MNLDTCIIVMAMWFITGIVNLLLLERIPKMTYACMWIMLMAILGIRILELYGIL